MYDFLIAPFTEFSFMRYALASVVFLALSAAPVGVFLVMRRMSLIGDALSHAVLPGAAAGYMFAGLSLPAMSAGGFAAGMLMALFAGLASRFTELKEDANFAAFYLTSLALGVTLVSLGKNSVDLLHLLFGSVLGVDLVSLRLMGWVAGLTVLALAVMYRPLLMESIDPLFLRAAGGRGGLWHVAFLILVVMNLVAGFQALGTLMSVGERHGCADGGVGGGCAGVRLCGVAAVVPSSCQHSFRPHHYFVLRTVVSGIGVVRHAGRRYCAGGEAAASAGMNGRRLLHNPHPEKQKTVFRIILEYGFLCFETGMARVVRAVYGGRVRPKAA